jgi:hypothetical protein
MKLLKECPKAWRGLPEGLQQNLERIGHAEDLKLLAEGLN